MHHASLAAPMGRALWVLVALAPLASAGQPCDGTLTPGLLGPPAVFVDDLPTSGDSALFELQAHGLEPLPGVESIAFASLAGGPLQPLVTDVQPGLLVAHVPLAWLDEPQLEFVAVNYITDLDEFCLSEPLAVQLQPGSAPGVVTIGGELRRWHTLRIDLRGPASHEAASPNPFLDQRLDVEFLHAATNTSYLVPGFFAADGDAAETSASAGDVWRACFTPDQLGIWTWSVSFRSGPGVAVDADPLAGQPDPVLDGLTGSFVVQPSNKLAPDFRGPGRLVHDGDHWLRFAEFGGPFLKGGVNSPENLLAYADFDATTPSHLYLPHAGDALPDDPTWQGGKGATLLGGLNYLSAQGLNAVYFLTFNVGGDGNDVWPWTTISERLRYDVSKLAQWERVFSHMDSLGLLQHVVIQETEIGDVLGAPDSVERRLYQRELVARFAHHLGLVWNLGEEIANSNSEIVGFAQTFEELDPYDHPVVVHTFPDEQDLVYPALLTEHSVNGASLQSALPEYVHAETLTWLAYSAWPGIDRPWVVCADEVGPYNVGAAPDGMGNDPLHAGLRADVLWGNLMAGGAGVEWYFGYAYPNDDLDCEDWRSRQLLWDQTRHALAFFQTYLPFTELSSHDELIVQSGDYGLAEPGKLYAFYDRHAASEMLVKLEPGTFTVRWYDPEHGGGLQLGTRTLVNGPGTRKLGLPPFAGDAVALVVRLNDSGDDLEWDAESESDPGDAPPIVGPP